jgi:hypothetical protein
MNAMHRDPPPLGHGFGGGRPSLGSARHKRRRLSEILFALTAGAVMLGLAVKIAARFLL